jgi:hypothetical protein
MSARCAEKLAHGARMWCSLSCREPPPDNLPLHRRLGNKKTNMNEGYRCTLLATPEWSERGLKPAGGGIGPPLSDDSPCGEMKEEWRKTEMRTSLNL